jgi:phosphate transport system substrate-binding protein
VKAALDGTADFGASDAPLSDADATAHRDVWHLPVAVEAIAIVYSLAAAGPARLQVSEDVLSDMLTGRVAWWDDPAIAALNPAVTLPHVAIRPVYRGDQSGSSYLLSEWLSRTSKHWSIPATRTLTLPGGTPAQKDDGMLARLRGSDGSLGYLSAVTALSEHVTSFAVRNPAGRFVLPSLEGMRAAASAADLGGDLRAHAVAAPGDLAYPVCSFTFVLVRADGSNAAARRALARFLWWATHDGQSFAPPLGFGALPGELQLRDEGVLHALRAGGEPAL